MYSEITEANTAAEQRSKSGSIAVKPNSKTDSLSSLQGDFTNYSLKVDRPIWSLSGFTSPDLQILLFSHQ